MLRQNSLIHDRWRVYRWTDRQVAEDGERVKEQLALFLGSIPGLLAFDDFLPKQRGEVVRLELIIDEAHHASADTYRGILAHFDADFILGLTATPERADGQSVLESFRDSAHRLGMPFEKFERRRYLKHDRDLANLRIAPNLWKQLHKNDLTDLRGICAESIAKYYERV